MQRLAAVIAAVWAGMLASTGAIAAPAAFAMLARADAGRFVNRLFAVDAYLSLVLAALLFLIERRRSRAAAEAGAGSLLSADLVLLLGTLFCTVAGYFAIQPMMEAARAGQGPWSFGALHTASAGFFVLKGLLVVALAWRLSASVRPFATS